MRLPRRYDRSDIRFRRAYPWSFRIRWEARQFDKGPDGRHEKRFRALEEKDPVLARMMRETFVRRWLDESGFPSSRFDEAMGTVDIRLAARRRRDGPDLRITSTFTGSTRWLYDWSGDVDEAIAFASETASDEAGWVEDERRLNGPTPWD